MAAVTICSDFEAQEDKVCHSLHCFPIYKPWSDGTGCHDLHFVKVQPAFSLSSFTFIKRLFSSSSRSAIRVVSSAYLRLLIFLLAILIPACASSSLAFHMMYSAYKLISKVTIFWTSLLFHVQFQLLLLDLHTDFSGGRSGGLVFPSLEELHTVCCDPHSQKLLVQFSRSVMSYSSRPHEPQHASPPCPSPTPEVHPIPCPLSQWCHPTISSSVVPLSSCSQSFPASGSFQMSQLLTSGGQIIGVSASTSVLPKNTQFSPLGWTGWISLQSKGLSRVFSNTTVQKHQFFSAQLSSQTNSNIHTWLLEKS